jgi:hypothetical protein
MKIVILASGLYILMGGVTIAYYPMNVPHPLGPCEQEQELSRWVRKRISETPLDRIPDMLMQENLGTTDPRHDWCVPRWRILWTIPPERSDKDTYGPIKPPLSIRRDHPLPPSRPRSLVSMVHSR